MCCSWLLKMKMEPLHHNPYKDTITTWYLSPLARIITTISLRPINSRFVDHLAFSPSCYWRRPMVGAQFWNALKCPEMLVLNCIRKLKTQISLVLGLNSLYSVLMQLSISEHINWLKTWFSSSFVLDFQSDLVMAQKHRYCENWPCYDAAGTRELEKEQILVRSACLLRRKYRWRFH